MDNLTKQIGTISRVLHDTVLYSNKVYFFEEIHRQKGDNRKLKNMNELLNKKLMWLEHKT